jgi:NAD(P)H dehydrogenase (quinone)
VAVIYHSRRGTQHALATAAAEGARAAGARIRVRRVTGPEDESTGPALPPALDDLVWADGIVWATPTYYGNVSAPIKAFLDTTNGLWARRALADCVVAGMTSSTSRYGGQEATLLALHRTMYHWGALVVSADPGSPGWHQLGGNAYGMSVPAGADGVGSLERAAAASLGARVGLLARLAAPLRDRRRAGQAPRPGSGGPPPRLAVLVTDDGPALSALAAELAAGASAAGAEVRVRRLPALPGDPPAGTLSPATPADVAWATALAWGSTPAAGCLPATMTRYVQQTDRALSAGELRGKLVTAFGAAANLHAGGESMLLSTYTAMHHWSALIAAPGYTDPIVSAAGGNPYGTLLVDDNGGDRALTLAAVRFQGFRLATLARQFVPAAGPVPVVG